MRARLLTLAVATLASAGCGDASRGTSDDAGAHDASECFPITHVCVTDEFGAPAVRADVTATREGAIPSAGRTGEDGCVDLYPEAGSWDLRARTSANCQNPTYTLLVDPSVDCGSSSVTLTATECFDG